jgi:hypothetical protein
LGSVIVDLYYDHFLCHKTEVEYRLQFQTTGLRRFKKEYWSVLPSRIPEVFLSVMVEHNWIYRTVEGMSHILYQMNKRTKVKASMQN